ncbi:MAG: hypothetical protein QG577_1667 [Thermodesulfobacteriota bacterium]|nr:hypothetical protein [Thermodesulfobacteriota bacterium]
MWRFSSVADVGLDFCLDTDTNSGIILFMTNIDKILEKMRRSPSNIKFGDACKVCEHYFGEPRQKSSSHRIFKVPWITPPLINIQNFKGKAKEYQVRQVLGAIEELEDEK